MEPIVQLDTHYTRSINLERDADSCDILSAYIPTSRALQTLDKIAETFNQKSMPRAWSLVGPYGSGKSSFAAFLAHLLEDQECTANVMAGEILKHHSPPVAGKVIAPYQRRQCFLHYALNAGRSESFAEEYLNARIWSQKLSP